MDDAVKTASDVRASVRTPSSAPNPQSMTERMTAASPTGSTTGPIAVKGLLVAGRTAPFGPAPILRPHQVCSGPVAPRARRISPRTRERDHRAPSTSGCGGAFLRSGAPMPPGSGLRHGPGPERIDHQQARRRVALEVEQQLCGQPRPGVLVQQTDPLQPLGLGETRTRRRSSPTRYGEPFERCIQPRRHLNHQASRARSAYGRRCRCEPGLNDLARHSTGRAWHLLPSLHTWNPSLIGSPGVMVQATGVPGRIVEYPAHVGTEQGWGTTHGSDRLSVLRRSDPQRRDPRPVADHGPRSPVR